MNVVTATAIALPYRSLAVVPVPELEILASVVASVAVDVMHGLRGQKRAAENFGHYQPVLHDVSGAVGIGVARPGDFVVSGGRKDSWKPPTTWSVPTNHATRESLVLTTPDGRTGGNLRPLPTPAGAETVPCKDFGGDFATSMRSSAHSMSVTQGGNCGFYSR